MKNLGQIQKILGFAEVVLFQDKTQTGTLSYNPLASSLEENLQPHFGNIDSAYFRFSEAFEERLGVLRFNAGYLSSLDAPTLALNVRKYLGNKQIHVYGLISILDRIYVLVDLGEGMSRTQRVETLARFAEHLSNVLNKKFDPLHKKIPIYSNRDTNGNTKHEIAEFHDFKDGHSDIGAIDRLTKGDVQEIVKRQLGEALDKIPFAKKQEMKVALKKQDILAAMKESGSPLKPQLEFDGLYTNEVLAVRNFMILKEYEPSQRRYGMATAATLAAMRAVAGKRLICKTKETGVVYCGTGVVLLGGTSGSGKSQCLDAAAKLYSMVTGVDTYLASKPTMAALLKHIQTMRHGGEKDRCLEDPRGFFWVADEFSASFKYLLADFSGSGSRDEGRFNTLFDSGSMTANDSLKSPMKVYDNCNLMLAGIQPYLYASEFNPFEEGRVASGFTGRLSVIFECEEFPTWDRTKAYDDNSNWEAVLDRLEKLYKTPGYIFCQSPDNLIDKFIEYCGDLAKRDVETVKSSAPKRVREALAEAALMTYMAGCKVSSSPAAQSNKSKWTNILNMPHGYLDCCGCLTIDPTILDNRLKSQAYQFINHYLGVSYFRNGSRDEISIKRALSGNPDGLRREHLIRTIDSTGRQYRHVGETIDAMISQGDLFMVKRRIGAKGRPQERILLPQYVQQGDAD